MSGGRMAREASHQMSRRVIILIVIVAATTVLAVILILVATQPSIHCKGSALCYEGTVEYIVDGDTLDIGGYRIRLTLVNTPESGQAGYEEAKQFTAALCPVGS